MSKLPNNWSQCEIGEVTQIVSGGTPPSKDLTNFVEDGGIPWITPSDLSACNGVFITRGARNLSEKGFESCSARKLPAGSVLFSSRASIGHVAIAMNELTTNQGFKNFVLPEELDSRFIYYYLRYATPIAEEMATGSTFKELSSSKAARLPLLVAPYQEQKRIADKLDTILVRIDRCRARLDRVRLMLNQFRQVVLAIMTSVKMTKDWGENEKTCRVCSLGSILTDIQYGTSKKSSYELENSIPVLRIPNIVNGRIDSTDLKYGQFTEKEKKNLYLKDGDLLIIRSNGSLDLVGRVAIVDSEFEGFLFAGYLIRLRVDTSSINPEYLAYYLSSPKIRKHIELTARNTNGINNINSKEIQAFEVELPPIEEQNEIVRHIKTLFALADRLAARCQIACMKLEHLTPAVLSKAFRGELVPQDPNDAPASMLVERIRAERATKLEKPKRVKTRKSKRTKMTEEFVKDAIRQLPEDKFSFDDLRSVIAGDYEQLKTILFNLLETEPSISQVFDESAKAIRFIRSIK